MFSALMHFRRNTENLELLQGTHYAYCGLLTCLKGIFYLDHFHDDSENLVDDSIKCAVLYH